jgi:hypothetical protein
MKRKSQKDDEFAVGSFDHGEWCHFYLVASFYVLKLSSPALLIPQEIHYAVDLILDDNCE